jgi:hypothetical protein
MPRSAPSVEPRPAAGASTEASLAPLVLEDPRRVGRVAAELIRNRLSARPRARLLLPTGRTPGVMYEALR